MSAEKGSVLEHRAGLTLTLTELIFITGFHQCSSASPFSQTEPDNDAYVRCSSRPCSPVHHEMHSKLSSSPPRSSPARLGPSYVLKKGSRGRGMLGGKGEHVEEEGFKEERKIS